MINIIKKYFIPHEANSHKPHILRTPALALFFGIILVSETAFLSDTLFVVPHIQKSAAVIASVVTDDTNLNRAAEHLTSLSPNPLLIAAAQAKADDMATKGYFSHTTPDGKSSWYWLKQQNYPYIYAGENLAIDFYNSQDVVNAWMNSPLHRANILNQHYTDIGIASAQGSYQGQPALFVVQFFGSTASSSVALASSSTTTPSATSSNSLITSNQASLFSALKGIVITQPATLINTLYLFVFTFIAFCLILAITIKTRRQHPRMIVGCLLLLLVIIILAGFNQEFSSALSVM